MQPVGYNSGAGPPNDCSTLCGQARLVEQRLDKQQQLTRAQACVSKPLK